MTTPSFAEFFASGDKPKPPPTPLWIDLTDVIKAKAKVNPRNLQVELGPSEVGHPCVRKLAYGLMQVEECNPDYDCLPSTFGVAMHTWLQEAFEWHNTQLGRRRWITETRVDVSPGLFGHADLYDCDSATVIDWKNLGTTTYVKYAKDIGSTYRGQIHMYGRGFVNAGFPVEKVAVAILPRSGTLSKMHLAVEDYDSALVDRILARREQTMLLLDTFDVENNPERYEWFESTPDTCLFCPWWSPNPKTPFQCKGDA